MKLCNIFLCLVIVRETASSHRLIAFTSNNRRVFFQARSFRNNRALSYNNRNQDNADAELLAAEEAAATDAHDVSDPGIEAASMERAVMLAEELREKQLRVHPRHNEQKQGPSYVDRMMSIFRQDKNKATDHADKDEQESSFELMDAEDVEITFGNEGYGKITPKTPCLGHDLSNEVDSTSKEESSKLSRREEVEEHYKSVEKDMEKIEHLISEAADADKSEGGSPSKTLSDYDRADLAVMMVEKSILAASDKLELLRENAEQTQYEIKTALEEKYAAKALAESLEREMHAAKLHSLSTEHFGDEADVTERLRDSSVLHADSALLEDALESEKAADIRLEDAIEHDIATKKELEQMIGNKAMLKQELHDLKNVIHQRSMSQWKKENARTKESKEKHHHFDWWHSKW